jgi:hypothetical protein
MKVDLIQGINSDGQEIIQKTQNMWAPSIDRHPQYTQYDLDNLVYITEQIRLKLKLLGSGRIWEL